MTRDIGLTCICLLSNIIPDSIFYDNMGWRGGTFAFFFFFWRGRNHCLSQPRKDGLSLITMGMDKPSATRKQGRWHWLSFDKVSILRILYLEFHWGVSLFEYVFFNHGCCGSSQYNVTDTMLQLDANKILNQNYVVFVTLIYMTYQSYQYFLSMLLGLWSVYGRCYVSHCFFLSVVVFNFFL